MKKMIKMQTRINTDKEDRFTQPLRARAGFTQIIILVSCFLILASGIIGCGYTTRSVITRDYQTIYVAAFVNKIDITGDTSVARGYKTYYPLLENDITRRVIDQFILDGNLRLTKEEDADLVLQGELVDYRKDALRYTGEDDNKVEEYRLSLAVNLSLYVTSRETLLWEVDNFIGDATYFTQASESLAIGEAVDDLARRVVSRVVDIW